MVSKLNVEQLLVKKNLTFEDRIQIQTMVENDHKPSEIAKYIGYSVSTIYRELKKVLDEGGSYHAAKAHSITTINMMRTSVQSPSDATIDLVEAKIKEDWSPEQISNWLKKNNLPSVSHTWIYHYIEEDQSKFGTLYKHLRHGKYTPQNHEYKGKIANRTSIEERPAIIDERTRLGDYEVDLIVGVKNRGAILSIIDRTSRLCKLRKLVGKTAQEVEAAIIEALLPYKSEIHTLTSDNGNEFTNHARIAEQLGIKYYFARPYASYERGSVENLNGLVRQYIPKGTDFSTVEAYTVKWIEQRLNNRPRKTLGYFTPIEFLAKTAKVA